MKSLLLLFCAAVFVGTAFGQTTGTITGTVKDQAGAVVPGANVKITNQATGTARQTATDSTGSYRATGLDPGTYQIQTSMQGFQISERGSVTLTVGSTAVVDFALSVGNVSESVSVTAEVPLIETNSAELSGLVGDKEIRDLPLNGRSYDALALLQPGVLRFTNDTENSIGFVTNGAGSKISIGGTPADFTSFLLDGTDIHDHSGFTPASVGGSNMGVDAILEFRVLTNDYSAAYGRTAGGVITAVTRSGTNEFHGTAFEFLRNNALDARQFFDVGGTKPFRRNQFGAAGGGPIRKDHTFFFANYEGLRQSLSTTFPLTVPDLDARSGIIPGPTGRQNIGVSPLIKPYLDLYPLPNSRNFGDGTAQFLWVTSTPTRDDLGSIRVDHQFSEIHSVFARVNIQDATVENPNPSPPFRALTVSRSTFVTVQEKTILSPHSLNMFKLAFNRTNPALTDQSFPFDSALAFVPGKDKWDIKFGATQGTSIGSLLTEQGHLKAAPQRFTQNVYQFGDDLDFYHDRHSLHAGVNLERIQINTFQDNSQPNYFFGSLQAYLQAQPFQYIGFAPGAEVNFGYRQWLPGFYAQDDLRATSKLNLNLGLRYEVATRPSEVHNHQSNILDVLHDSGPTTGTVFKQNPSLGAWEPRVGFAWTPFGESKPVIRGGAGIYHNQIMGRMYYSYVRNQFSPMVNIPNPPFPHPNFSNIAGNVTYSTWDPDAKTPTVYQYNLNVQQQLPSHTVVTLGYAGSHGFHWPRIIEANPVTPRFLPDGTPFYVPGSPRLNPKLGEVTSLTTDGVFNYNSFQVEVVRRFTKGLQVQLSYTYSNAITDATAWQVSNAVNMQGSSMIPFDRSADRSASPWEQHHVLVANYTYRLPGESLSGWRAVAVQGWEMSGIFSASTGFPFTINLGSNRSGNGDTKGVPDRPNLLPGRSSNPVIGSPDRWYDPTAFSFPAAGTYGNLGRNTVFGPGIFTVDFSLAKTFHVTERHLLAIRGEFFNLFNRANFGLPNRFAFTSTGAYAGNAGVIQTLSTPSRQIQFGARYSF